MHPPFNILITMDYTSTYSFVFIVIRAGISYFKSVSDIIDIYLIEK